jgi:hypothetical protein
LIANNSLSLTSKTIIVNSSLYLGDDMKPFIPEFAGSTCGMSAWGVMKRFRIGHKKG